MKRIWFWIVLVLLAAMVAIYIINDRRAARGIASLEAQLDSVKLAEQEKDKTINEFFTSLESIESSLRAITHRERQLGESMQNYNDQEIQEDDRIRIQDEILEINRMMKESQNKLNDMSKKLKASNLKIAEFEKRIAASQRQLIAKDSTIRAMVTQMESLNLEVDSLQIAVLELDSTRLVLEDSIRTQHDELDRAWYAIGTTEELMANSVIEKKRGPRGLGKHYALLAEPNMAYCTEVSRESTLTIPVHSGKKGVHLITSHPQASYELVEEENGSVKEIRILNPKQFWQTSKFLVVVIR